MWSLLIVLPGEIKILPSHAPEDSKYRSTQTNASGERSEMRFFDAVQQMDAEDPASYMLFINGLQMNKVGLSIFLNSLLWGAPTHSNA